MRNNKTNQTASVASVPVPPRAVRAGDIVDEIQRILGTQAIDSIYSDQILIQRTRRYDLNATSRTTLVEVLHTLLGVELKVGNRRLLCPDLATARYLSIFARLGCESIAIPYDITQVSHLADELESSWYRMMLLVEHMTGDRGERLRGAVRKRLTEHLRDRIKELGAGAKYPQFRGVTRQRYR